MRFVRMKRKKKAFSGGGGRLVGKILREGDEREGKERSTCGVDGMGWSMYG